MLILIVDDDREDQALLAEALAIVEPQSRVLTAEDGGQALQMLEDLVVFPDCIFLDINMPVVNGKETLSAIKTEERTRHIRTVMYSTTSLQSEIEECYRLGADDFLVKPPRFETLLTDVRRIIGRAPSPTA